MLVSIKTTKRFLKNQFPKLKVKYIHLYILYTHTHTHLVTYKMFSKVFFSCLEIGK